MKNMKALMATAALLGLAGCLPASNGGDNNDGGDATTCGADERVSSSACVVCDEGYENERGDDVSGADTECDPVTEPGKGRLVATPRRVAFEPVQVGGSSEVTVTLENIGDTALTITSFGLEEESRGDSLREITASGVPEAGTVVEPGASVALAIGWSPLDTTRDHATITLGLEGALLEELTLEVTTPSLDPDILAPAAVLFPNVAPGESATQLLAIENVGGAPLQLTDIFLASTVSNFSLSFPTPGQESDPGSDTDTWAAALEPGGSLPVRVTFSPASDQPDGETIVVTSNDPDTPTLRIELSANASSSAIELDGVLPADEPVDGESHLLAFGARGVGQQHVETVQIRNEGSGDLILDEITLAGDGVFSISSDVALDADVTLTPGESVDVAVTFEPTAEGTSKAKLTIGSSDAAAEELVVLITGEGADVECPTSVGRGRVEGSAGAYTATISAPPLASIEFDGSQSVGAARYEWSIVQRPASSTSRLTPNDAVANPRLFLDVIGNYIIELKTFDADGVESCEASTVMVSTTSTSNRAVTLQITWETPADRDQTDIIGTDMDLHYLNKLGSWDKLPYDIYWNNREADWGTRGDDTDDPKLDIDDSDGAGPEIINHDDPSPNDDYSVGVYYYSDNGFGASYATIQIHVGGVLEYESRDKYMEKENVFWHAVDITGRDLTVKDVDQLRQGFPNTP